MTIAKDFASKAAVAFVAAATIFSLIAPVAQAQSATDLQKMIDDLMKQVAALQGQGGTSGSVASGICPFTWTRDLKTGTTGADVMKLQQFLNSNADTRVAASGAGSVGMETQYFGPATAAAVSKFQVMHRADILTPANLTNPTGFFGPGTRAKVNALCVAMPSVPSTPTGTSTDTSTPSDPAKDELKGEGTLETFEMDDASDTDIQEGASDEVIGEITVEAVDGDIELDRMTFTLDDGSAANTEAQPWDVFEDITLWIDGKKVATFEADDEDNYLDEDDGEFRFSGLGIVLREDEEVEIAVAASVVGNVDSAGDATLADWDLTATAVRYFDADGVAEDDTTTDELPSAEASITIVTEGDGEELKFALGSNNPDAKDIVVDTDDTTDGVTIMEYTLEAEENDIKVETLAVILTTTATATNVIDDVELVIDGKTYKDTLSTSTTLTRTYTFDIDKEVTVKEDSKVTVTVKVDLKSQEMAVAGTSGYPNGTTIKAEVTSTQRDLTVAEGADDLGTADYSGTAVGKAHTLVAEGIMLPVSGVTTSADTTGDNDQTGEFTIEFDVKAVEGTFYITDNTNSSSTSAADGIAYEVEVGTGTTTVSGVLSSTADEETDGVYTVRDGETETFTLTVTVDTSASTQARVTLTEVNYSTATDGTSATMAAYTPTPASDFRTAYKNVNAD